MIHRRGAVVCDQYGSYAAEKFEHPDMGFDPVPGPFVHERFDKGMATSVPEVEFGFKPFIILWMELRFAKWYKEFYGV